MFYRIRRFLRFTRAALTVAALLGMGLVLTRDQWEPLARSLLPAMLVLAGILAGGWLWTKRRHRVPPSLTSTAGIAQAIFALDWYAFEKLNAAILRHEGFAVERRGGAQPDGGVDLIARRDGHAFIVQCKHWQKISLPEYVVRELLGSMADCGIPAGAVHCLVGPTQPAVALAARHGIQICSAEELARRAQAAVPASTLASILSDRVHHCPKCDSSMVLRQSNHGQFWSCTRFPRCSGTIREGSRF